jgi:hypothetical protein
VLPRWEGGSQGGRDFFYEKSLSDTDQRTRTGTQIRAPACTCTVGLQLLSGLHHWWTLGYGIPQNQLGL